MKKKQNKLYIENKKVISKINFMRPFFKTGSRYVISKTIKNYHVENSSKNYLLLRCNTLTRKIVAAWDNVIVKQKVFDHNTLYLYPNYKNKYYFRKITLTKKYFIGLLDNSMIQDCYILPYIREVEPNKYYRRWRLVIITTKCQIYHNFPNRETNSAGYEYFNDIVRFEESVIWDVIGRRHPSKNQNAMAPYIYYPYLPDDVYSLHPIPNNSEGFIDRFNNGGFSQFKQVDINDRKGLLSRFYFPIRNAKSNPFMVMGGVSIDYKLTVLGTYQSNTDASVRVVLFTTSDGGREWFSNYEFSDTGEYEFRQGDSLKWGCNWGNPINTIALKSIDQTSIKFKFYKKELIDQNGQIDWEKEFFRFTSPNDVDYIEFANHTIVKSVIPHKLVTGNIILLVSDLNQNSDFLGNFVNNYFFNDNLGNGIFYKVHVIDHYRFEILENVSSPLLNALPCRHIHHINPVRDGWIIGTGEIYPNGWLIYMQMREADTFSIVKAEPHHELFQLTKSKTAIQRTMGVELDTTTSSFIFASDHDLLPFKEESFINSITRNSTGIYKIAFTDIDDYTKAKCIYELTEPAYFFKKLGKYYVFSGQRGEFAIFNLQQDLHFSRTDGPLVHYKGRTDSFFVIDDRLLVII